ncbi:hypothetical protein E2C01_030128 [Portunus trituberculatus]|uniref:Endonuclease/exonuclease/phosphatase domain-containing protein n=1 Tax=Portunus trituberculatus TaxID=210409 RepID=A0A5B7EQ42_PORTR|nr:hypothetical protein [Portunus trituberculatus]
MIDDTIRSLARIIKEGRKVILVGDFNCKEVDWENYEREQLHELAARAPAAAAATAAAAAGQTVTPGGLVGTRGSHTLEQHILLTPTLRVGGLETHSVMAVQYTTERTSHT